MNENTLLLRVISPAWWLQDNRVSSMAFRPGPGDDGQLSVYDGDQIEPSNAYRHYANDPQKPQPVGVLAVTPVECAQQELGVVPDPQTFPEHVLIDFRKFGTSSIKRKSAQLRDIAQIRGWLHRA